jgi:hypothetical protein
MESHLTVDYDELVSAYKESLTTVLRGFRPPAELLETWVPDEDDAKSILNIIEAAEGAGLTGITIRVGTGTFRRLDLTGLQEAAGWRGKVDTAASGDAILLNVSFAGTDELPSGLDRYTATYIEPEMKAIRKSAPLPSYKALSPQTPVRSGKQTVHTVYKERLKKKSQMCPHEGALSPDYGLELVQTSRENATLMALVEPSQHSVKKAAFHGARSGDERAVLDLLCQFMEGKPILECADHGMIYVERQLRDTSQPAPVPGIVTPENADPIFSSLTLLVRELFACYRRRIGFNSTANSYDLPPTIEWLALPEDKKVEKVQAAIGRHPLGLGIEVVRTEGSKRVSVMFQHALGPNSTASRLMQLEAYIQSEVEPTLELETEPRADANKIRRIKEMNRS